MTNRIESTVSMAPLLEEALKPYSVSLQDSKKIADSVMKLSTFYLENPTKETPWKEAWCQIAYIAYYMPLNLCRNIQAVQRGVQVGFFKDFGQFVDFGSGLGSIQQALEFLEIPFPNTSTQIEVSKVATLIHQKIASKTKYQLNWASDAFHIDIKPKTLATFSYSFTELEELPDWALNCDGLMIVEPATQKDSRRLMEVRSSLIEKGWRIYAPCTHHESCPLLTGSERDWCHDRAVWAMPEWIQKVEAHMPIKNGTLPFSYLLARKEGPVKEQVNGFARITGDLQGFKGYSKQLVCRSKDREFLSWQQKIFGKKIPNIPRGSLVEMSQEEISVKGNELRLTGSEQIKIVL